MNCAVATGSPLLPLSPALTATPPATSGDAFALAVDTALQSPSQPGAANSIERADTIALDAIPGPEVTQPGNDAPIRGATSDGVVMARANDVVLDPPTMAADMSVSPHAPVVARSKSDRAEPVPETSAEQVPPDPAVPASGMKAAAFVQQAKADHAVPVPRASIESAATPADPNATVPAPTSKSRSGPAIAPPTPELPPAAPLVTPDPGGSGAALPVPAIGPAAAAVPVPSPPIVPGPAPRAEQPRVAMAADPTAPASPPRRSSVAGSKPATIAPPSETIGLDQSVIAAVILPGVLAAQAILPSPPAAIESFKGPRDAEQTARTRSHAAPDIGPLAAVATPIATGAGDAAPESGAQTQPSLFEPPPRMPPAPLTPSPEARQGVAPLGAPAFRSEATDDPNTPSKPPRVAERAPVERAATADVGRSIANVPAASAAATPTVERDVAASPASVPTATASDDLRADRPVAPEPPVATGDAPLVAVTPDQAASSASGSAGAPPPAAAMLAAATAPPLDRGAIASAASRPADRADTRRSTLGVRPATRIEQPANVRDPVTAPTPRPAASGAPGEPFIVPADPKSRKIATDPAAPASPAPIALTPATEPPIRAVTAPDVKTASPIAPTPAEPVVVARPGRIGHEVGVEIARRVSAGGDELVVRLVPAELGRIEVRLSFDERGGLRAVIAADSPVALDMLRRDSADLTRSLSDAGVRSDAQSLRFQTDGGSGQGNGQPRSPWLEADGRAGRGARDARFVEDAEPVAYRSLRTGGSYNLLA